MTRTLSYFNAMVLMLVLWTNSGVLIAQEESTDEADEKDTSEKTETKEEDAEKKEDKSEKNEKDKGDGSLRRSNRMEFDERLIKGQAAKSGAVYLFKRTPRNLPGLVPMRKSYRKRIVEPILGERALKANLKKTKPRTVREPKKMKSETMEKRVSPESTLEGAPKEIATEKKVEGKKKRRRKKKKLRKRGNSN